MTTQTSTETKTRTKQDLAEPPMFRVIYINDDKTTVDFVIASLEEHFQYTKTTAEQICMEIHQSGSAVVAVLPYEIAEQKGIEVTISARNEGYPLQIKIEPDV